MNDKVPKRLTAHPPAFLEPFRTVLVEDGPNPVYALSCLVCEAELFDLFLIESCLSDDESCDIGIESVCCGCGNRRVLFDMTLHGYDGEYGHWHALRGERGQGPLKMSNLKTGVSVRLQLSYSIPLEELEVHASELGKAPQDLFDWITLTCRDDAGVEWKDVWDCECA